MTNIIVHGCCGRMGRAVCELAREDARFKIIAGLDITPPAAYYPVYTSFDAPGFPAADVTIDFSTVTAAFNAINHAVKTKTPIVVCTTGFDKTALDEINTAAEKIPVFMSANMSVGIALLNYLSGKTAAVLTGAGLGFDIEIIEKHHNKKLDAPSGTALLLGKTINAALDNSQNLLCGRPEGIRARDKTEIGIHAVRGGTITGEHTVMFAGPNEVVELTHKALSREVFAAGALNAAAFLAGQKPGIYGMDDMLEKLLTGLR